MREVLFLDASAGTGVVVFGPYSAGDVVKGVRFHNCLHEAITDDAFVRVAAVSSPVGAVADVDAGELLTGASLRFPVPAAETFVDTEFAVFHVVSQGRRYIAVEATNSAGSFTGPVSLLVERRAR